MVSAKFSTIISFTKNLIIFSLFILSQSLWSQDCSVNAGINETICENSSYTLDGSASGMIQSTPVWSQISGPSVIIDNPFNVKSDVTGLVGGNSYTFRLSADCNDGSTQFQDVTIVVQPITIANAGNNIASCPNNTGALSIAGNAPDNTNGESGEWIIVGDNDAGVVVTTPNASTTTINLPEDNAGVTILQWTITGPNYALGQFCESSDTITVTNYGGQQPINAGADQNLDTCYSVSQSTILNGSFGGNNINGQQGAWSFVSGPSVPNFVNNTQNNTNVSNLIEGIYILRWSVTGPCVSGQDTMTITVDSATQDITNARVLNPTITYCDPSITTATLEGIPPRFANETVTWTQTRGATASILNNSNSTTQVSGLSDSGGPYTFRYRITNNVTFCESSANVRLSYATDPITITANNGNIIIASCAEVKNIEIPYVITGNGSNSYAIISGPATSTIVNSNNFIDFNSDPLTIDFDVEGTYAVQLRRALGGAVQTGCSIGNDVVNVTISRQPSGSNAGTSQILACNVTSTTLAGNSPAIGTTLWSQVRGPNTAIISDAYIDNPDLTGLISGTYTFKYTVTGGIGCPPPVESTVNVEVSSDTALTTNAGTAQTVCYGTPVKLAAQSPSTPNLSGVWTVDAAPSGTIISFEDDNDPNTLVSGLTDATANANYIFRWTVSNPKNAACPPSGFDTVTITTNGTAGSQTAVAGPFQCISGTPTTTTISLAGNEPAADEIGTWTAVPNTDIIFTNPNLYNTTADITAVRSYILTWTLEKTAPGCQSSSDDIEITIGDMALADAGPDQGVSPLVCSSDFTMAASSSAGGTGTWSQITGPGGVTSGGTTIEGNTDPSAIFNFTFSGEYIFEWTVINGSCSINSDTVLINVGIPPTTAATGIDQTICNNTSAVLIGNEFNSKIENGFWSLLSGAPNVPSITIQPDDRTINIDNMATGSYTFRWTISGSPSCPSSFDDVTVDVFAPANAGEDIIGCDVTNFLLEATFGSTGIWAQVANGAPTATITQNPPNSSVAEISITPGDTYEFSFTTNYNDPNCNTNLTDTVLVTSSSKPPIAPDAGTDQSICTDTTTSVLLAGNDPLPGFDTTNANNSAFWRIVSAPDGSNATFTDATVYNTDLNNLTVQGVYVLEWNFDSGFCEDTSDIVRIEVYDAPSIAEAGDDAPFACQVNAVLDATTPAIGLGTWTVINEPNTSTIVIDSPNDPKSTLSNITVNGTYNFRWTVTNGSCTSSQDDVSFRFTTDPPAEPDAGPDQELCQANTTTLNALAISIGTGTWSQTKGPGVNGNSGATATIVSPTNETTTISNLEAGNYEFTWTVTNGGCEVSDTIELVNYAQPSSADAGIDQTLDRFANANLVAANPTTGTGVWTQISGPSTANIIDATDPNTAIAGTVEGSYIFEWTVSNQTCPVSSDTVEISFLQGDLELSKTVSPTTANVGETVTFTIAIFNNDSAGSSDISGVSVKDFIPDGFSLVEGSVSNGGAYNLGDASLIWSNLNIPNGDTINLTFDVTVNATGSYINSAEIIASDVFDIDSTPNNNEPTEDDQDTTEVTVLNADLRLFKTVTPVEVSVGDLVTFTLRVRNQGPDLATGVAIKETVPSGYTIVTVDNGGTISGNEIIWSNLSVASSANSSVTFTATVNAPTGVTNEYLNTAEISASDVFDPDSTPNNSDENLNEDDEDSASITLDVEDLQLSISPVSTTTNIGDIVGYTITVLNDPTASANSSGVTVVSVLDNGLDIVSGSISNGGIYNLSNRTITWNNLAILNGDTTNLGYSVSINSNGNYNTLAQITKSDLIDVDSTPNNNVPTEDDQTEASLTIERADLTLTKAVNPITASVGELVTFTIQVDNEATASATATGVEIRDMVPNGYTIVSINNSGTRNGSAITWALPPIAIASNTAVSFTATVNMPNGATNEYRNEAQIIASDQTNTSGNPNIDNDDASIVLKTIDLELTKTLNNTTGNVGEDVTVTINLANNSANGTGDGTGITIVEQLPNGFDINGFTISNGGVYNPSNQTITWGNISLANGANLDLSYTATTNDSGNYTSITEITTSDLDDFDSTPNNGVPTEDDYAVASFTIQEADLSLVKNISSSSNSTPNIGDTIIFELQVTNSGPDTATNVRVEDFIPKGYSLQSINNGGTALIRTFLAWDIASIPVGTTTVSYEVTVNTPSGDANEYLNVAEITASDQADPDSEPFNGNGSGIGEDDEDFYEITPQIIDLDLNISVSNTNPNIGDTVTFTIAISNNGTALADGVNIQDLIPAGFGNILAISNGGIVNSGTIIWSGITVPVGTNTQVLTFTAEVLTPTGVLNEYQHVTQVTAANQYDVDSTPNNNDGNQREDDEDEISITIQIADLSIIKTANTTAPNVGETVQFTLAITNTGANSATGVSITDILPQGFTLTSVNNGGAITGSDLDTALWSGLAILGNGGSLELTYEAVVNEPTGIPNEYLNIAQIIASDQYDPDSNPSTGITVDEDGNGDGYDDDETSLNLNPAIGDLSLTKIVVDNDVTPNVGCHWLYLAT